MTYIQYPNYNIITPQIIQPIKTYIQPIVQVKQIVESYAAAFKPKKAGSRQSHIIFVLDDSGSMQSCRDNTISGFNEYLTAQKLDQETSGIKTYISLFKFDGSKVVSVYDRQPVGIVPLLSRDTYNPNGGTNLLDAIGGVMMHVNKNLAEKKSRRDSVIITILTDGEENSSRTFSNNDIKQMVEKAEAANWGFMFLGANIDAFDAGSSMGFNEQNTVQYTNASTANAMRSAAQMTTRLKHAYDSNMTTDLAYASTTFSDQERSVAMTKDNI